MIIARRFLASICFLLVFSSWFSAIADEILVVAVYVDSEGKEVDLEFAPGFTVPHAKCVFQAGGFGGGIKWTPDGNVYGCKRDAGSVLCSGMCERCELSGEPGKQWVFSEGDSCHIPTNGVVIKCGFLAKYGCTTTVHPGYPEPANGCCCDLGNPISPPSAVCMAKECQS
ncbi:MAG: hypothetical protein ACK4WH_08735 [Phycisphaerales bacterium]